jgi:protein-tyrosine-phosphatase
MPAAKIALFLDAANRFTMTDRSVVPDPYYRGDAGFSDVFGLVSLGCDAILKELQLR